MRIEEELTSKVWGKLEKRNMTALTLDPQTQDDKQFLFYLKSRNFVRILDEEYDIKFGTVGADDLIKLVVELSDPASLRDEIVKPYRDPCKVYDKIVEELKVLRQSYKENCRWCNLWSDTSIWKRNKNDGRSFVGFIIVWWIIDVGGEKMVECPCGAVNCPYECTTDCEYDKEFDVCLFLEKAKADEAINRCS